MRKEYGIRFELLFKKVKLFLMLHLNCSKSKRSQKVIWLNENKEEYLRGAILPIIAVSGTITRYHININFKT